MSTPTATPRTDDGLLAVALACEYVKESVTLAGTDMKEHGADIRRVLAELSRLRADLERFTGHGLLDCHAICDQRDAAIARAERAEAALAEAKVERETVAEASLRSLEAYIDKLKQFAERADAAEAALAEWSVLDLWGGTPEIIHEFIKGQQNRIHHCQDLEAECLEQARLLGMSGEREADLLGKIERLAKDNARLDWLEEKMWFVRANVMLHDEVPPYTVKTCDGIVHGATVRAAIDAAMKP